MLARIAGTSDARNDDLTWTMVQIRAESKDGMVNEEYMFVYSSGLQLARRKLKNLCESVDRQSLHYATASHISWGRLLSGGACNVFPRGRCRRQRTQSRHSPRCPNEMHALASSCKHSAGYRLSLRLIHPLVSAERRAVNLLKRTF